MKKNLLFVIAILLCSFAASAQETEHLRVAFWNFENFFDPFVDSTKTYNEFTPDGNQHWTTSRFYKKRNNMYKAILAMSENEPIAIMGICEVENEYVLNMLFSKTPLGRHNYRFVHFDSPDRRGIDCAIVYSKDKVKLLESKQIPLKNPNDSTYRSRDVIYGKFSDLNGDTLHVFVNHWPSRYGGEMETIPFRAMAARNVLRQVDSIVAASTSTPKIIIMGDLNDCPTDPSIDKVLNAKPLGENTFLVNLITNPKELGFDGTIKHNAEWTIFDQIIVSSPVVSDTANLHYKPSSARIFSADFMLLDDESYGGKKIFRTYIGPKYFGGFSDHLPVYIDLER